MRRAQHRARHRGRHRRGARRPRRQSRAHRAVDRPRRPRTRRGGELLAYATVGLAAAAHAELAEPAARPALRRPGPRRLHDDGRGGRLHRALRRGRAGSGPDRHRRDVGAPGRRRLPGADQRRRDQVPDRGRGQRRLQPADGAAVQRGGAGLGHPADPVRLPRPGPPPRRRGARGRSLGDGRTAGRRAGAIGPAGDPLGRRARPDAAYLPRPRRALVDGPDGRLGRAVRRGRRPDPGPAPSVAAAGRYARTRHPRPQRARRPGRRAGRPVGDRAGRRGPVLRWAAQRVLTRRPQARAAAGRLRRVGPGPRRRRRCRPARALSRRPGCRRPHAGSSTCAAARSARSCGPPAFGPTTGGSTCPWSTRRATLRHDGGAVDSPGMYALGLPVLRRRKSTFIHGIEDDAREVVDHLSGYLAHKTRLPTEAGR